MYCTHLEFVNMILIRQDTSREGKQKEVHTVWWGSQWLFKNLMTYRAGRFKVWSWNDILCRTRYRDCVRKKPVTGRWTVYSSTQLMLLVWTIDTNLLIPWSRVLLEKLTGFQLVKKFPGFYGTQRFITTVRSARHLSLSWSSPYPPHPTAWRSILILSPNCVSQVVSFPQVSPPNPCIRLSSPPYPLHALLFILSPEQYWVKEYRSLSSSLCSFLHYLVTSSLLGPNILLSILFSNALSLCSSLNVSDQVSHPHKTRGKIIVLYILIFKFLDNKICWYMIQNVFLRNMLMKIINLPFGFLEHCHDCAVYCEVIWTGNALHWTASVV